MLWPKEYGGWGATPMQQAIVQDEMARISSPPAINGLGIGFIGPTIIVHGTEAQKKRYLKKMLTAEEICHAHPGLTLAKVYSAIRVTI